MNVIALIDPVCPRGYSTDSLEREVLGGTEATVLRVADRLSDRFRFNLFQAKRTEIEQDRFGQLLPLDTVDRALLDRHHAIIVINSWKVALKMRRRAPNARILLWLHVLPGRHNRGMGAALARAGIEVICVSRSHAARLGALLGGSGVLLPAIGVVPNPIADDLGPDGTAACRDRLLFASSRHKGLREVFDVFRALRTDRPDLRLEVADPGYLAWDAGPVPEGVTFLGSLRHAELMARMRRALCLFYPQTTFHETFGLVIAEANAVGTPAILHGGLGANDEVASSEDQCIDCTDLDLISARLDRLRTDRPQTRGRDEFRLSAVAAAWAEILGASRDQPVASTDRATRFSTRGIRGEVEHVD